MADTIMQILMWAIPSGGIGAAISWFCSKKIRNAKMAKEIHDIYKTMYDDVSVLVIKLQKENEKLNTKVDELSKENERTRRSLNRLCRAIEAIQLCPHRSSCPVRNELSLTEDDDKLPQQPKRTTGGQHRNRDAVDRGEKDTHVTSGDGDSDGQPP